MERSTTLHVVLRALSLGLFFAWQLVSQAQVVRQVTDLKTDVSIKSDAALDDAGTFVVARSSADPFGSNPRHAFQIVKWDAASGLGSQLGDFPEGADSVSVSDDGQWIAFVSAADPLGQNHDESEELFVMHPDGTAPAQLTSDPVPNSGSVIAALICGSGSRVVFVANIDPLGSNPAHVEQYFAIDRTGTGLAQLTNATTNISYNNAYRRGFSVSDNGQRLVFSHDGDLTGGNADGSVEIFAVNGDGTNLRQLTSSTAPFHSQDPAIAGSGNTIVFFREGASGGLYRIFWTGAGLLFLGPGSGHSISDDGFFVYYGAADANNSEIMVRDLHFPATQTQLTFTSPPLSNGGAVVSGSGNRIAFTTSGGAHPGGSNPDGGPELMVMDASGANIRQLTANTVYPWFDSSAEITPDGSRIVFTSTNNYLGTDPEHDSEIYRVQADGTGLVQVSQFTDADGHRPSVSADGNTIVFTSQQDLTGNDPCGDGPNQVYRIHADGTGLLRLSVPGPSCDSSFYPVIAANGSVVVFQSAVGSDAPLFRVMPDGTGLLQLTNDNDSLVKNPRLSESGAWVVFQSETNQDGGNPDFSRELFRVRTDGTGYERLTADPLYDSFSPDISGDGERIAYSSTANPLGTNADHNSEIFLLEPATSTRSQLTITAEGDSYTPLISGDGAWVFFRSDTPFLESAPDAPYDLYRLSVATGMIERVGALRHGGAELRPGVYEVLNYDRLVPDADGDRAVFSGPGDWTDQNGDGSKQIWLVDHSAPAGIRVGEAAPTVVSWDPEPQPLRYDVIRGGVANLHSGANQTVDLGAVVCLEDNSPDTSTLGFEDVLQPAAGQVFFYLYRGSQGVGDGPGSWGQGTGARERVAAAGDCQP